VSPVVMARRRVLNRPASALQRKGNEHAQDGDDDGPKNHLPRGQDPPGHQHVGGKAGGQRCHHIARGRGDGLGAVVLEDREPTAHRRFPQQAEQGEGDEHRGESHADGNARLGTDVERGGREHAAQQESREGRPDRELGHISPEDVLQPPLVLLGSTQGTDLLVGERGECHDATVPQPPMGIQPLSSAGLLRGESPRKRTRPAESSTAIDPDRVNETSGRDSPLQRFFSHSITSRCQVSHEAP
jgi:hypothetical protein